MRRATLNMESSDAFLCADIYEKLPRTRGNLISWFFSAYVTLQHFAGVYATLFEYRLEKLSDLRWRYLDDVIFSRDKYYSII